MCTHNSPVNEVIGSDLTHLKIPALKAQLAFNGRWWWLCHQRFLGRSRFTVRWHHYYIRHRTKPYWTAAVDTCKFYTIKSYCILHIIYTCQNWALSSSYPASVAFHTHYPMTTKWHALWGWKEHHSCPGLHTQVVVLNHRLYILYNLWLNAYIHKCTGSNPLSLIAYLRDHLHDADTRLLPDKHIVI